MISPPARARLLETAALLGPFVVACVMAFAAVAKIFSLEEFKLLTSTFTVLPPAVRAVLPFAVPQVELTIAAMLLLAPRRRGGIRLAIGALCVFTGYLLVQSYRPFVPACHCFGIVRLATTAARENQFGVWRNLLLISLCLLALKKTAGGGPPRDGFPRLNGVG